MGYIFIFEDDSFSPSSMLLSENIEGVKFIFSGGIDHMIDDISDLCSSNSNDIVYAFVDTVPDNRITIDKYSAIVQIVVSCGRSNIFVLPIMCMEYYIIKMLSLYYDFKVAKDKKSMYLSYVIHEDFKYPVPDGKTLEKCYKDILNSNLRNCMINNVSRGNGKFYKINCRDCNRMKCSMKMNENEGLLSKAVCLYTRFPLFGMTSVRQESIVSSICMDLEKVDIKAALAYIREYYTDVFRALDMSGNVVLSGILLVLSRIN